MGASPPLPEASALHSTRSGARKPPLRFLAVITLYKLAPEDSSSFRTLQRAISQLDPSRGSVIVLLHDNSPSTVSEAELAPNVRYQHTCHNAGLSDAFNSALEMAMRENCDWLLTLDQDTDLPVDFLERICHAAELVSDDPAIAAVVPQIVGEDRMLSPNWFWAGAIPVWFPKGFVGVPNQPTFAFNSASTLRVSALRQIGGYNKWFWLDNSDAAVFHELHRYGKRIFVAGDIQVNHNFSMLNIERRMTAHRYHNILMAESAFWDLAMNPLAGAERTARLFVRWCKQLLRGDEAKFRRETARALMRRIFTTRRSRLTGWKRELLDVRPELAKVPEQDRNPKLSVCLATCNGEKFVREQLMSILDQLGAHDEIIIVDDASEDHTKEIIAALDDDRIRLIENQQRQGVVRTFERAVRAASGDLLFLSDQDDIWAPNKVSRFVDAFDRNPEAMIVTSDIQTIDEFGNPLTDHIYSQSRPFTSSVIGNLISNRFQGAAMAFRSRILTQVLPFPEGFHLLHDAWIGTRNSATGGKAICLDEKLLLYRRHSGNASNRLHVAEQVLKRLRLLLALVTRWFKNRWTPTAGLP